jgi:hypothetical protein
MSALKEKKRRTPHKEGVRNWHARIVVLAALAQKVTE